MPVSVRSYTACLVFLSVARVVVGRSRPLPQFSETFCVQTREFDSTSPPTPPVLEQTICKDVANRRHLMIADGPLVRGHLEELVICLDPLGWELDVGGRGSSTQCTNTSLPIDSGLCDFTQPFWAFPANASYQGPDANVTTDLCRGPCDRWDYWDGGEQYAFWATPLPTEPALPVRLAKTFTTIPGYSLWHIDWFNFSSAPPPASVFAPPAHLPPCSPGGQLAAPSPRLSWEVSRLTSASGVGVLLTKLAAVQTL